MLASMCVKAERTKRSGRLANVDILIFLFILLFSYSIFDAIYERVIMLFFFASCWKLFSGRVFGQGGVEKEKRKTKLGRPGLFFFFLFKSFLAFMLYIIAGERVKIAY